MVTTIASGQFPDMGDLVIVAGQPHKTVFKVVGYLSDDGSTPHVYLWGRVVCCERPDVPGLICNIPEQMLIKA